MEGLGGQNPFREASGSGSRVEGSGSRLWLLGFTGSVTYL